MDMELADGLPTPAELQAGWRISPSIAFLGQLLSFCYRIVFWCLTLVTYHVPRWTISILSWGGVISLEFNFVKLCLVFLALGIALNWTIKARYLNKYSKLRETPLRTDEKLDLHPDVAAEASSGGINNYLDEFCECTSQTSAVKLLKVASVSAIKVFGYLERPVFHELARHLQTRRLLAGETLSLDSADFYVVVDGTMQVYAHIKDSPVSTPGDFDEDPEDNGYQLLNEVETGGTLSSLFTILRLFTEDVSLRYEEAPTEDRPGRPKSNNRDVPAMQLDTLNFRNSPFDARRRGSMKQQARVPSRLRNSFSSDKTVTDPAAALTMPSRPEVTFPKQNGELSFEQALITDDDHEDHTPDWRDTANAGSKRARLSSDESEAHERAASTGPSQATVARAKVDSTLAVLPAEAFKRLTHKFPKASAHIVQVILTRLHRVTFLTAHEYLGLTKELVKTEKAINDLACYPLPAKFYETGGIERLRQRFLQETKAVDQPAQPAESDYFSERRKSSYPLATPYHGPQMGKNMHTDSSFDFGPEAIRMRSLSRNPSLINVQTSPMVASPGSTRSRESSSSFSGSRVSRNVGDLLSMTSLDNTTNLMSHSPEKGSIALPAEDGNSTQGGSPRKHISFAVGEADNFDLREEVMTCISKSIGLIQPSHSSAPSAEGSPVLHATDGSLKRAVFSTSFGSLSYLGMHGRDDETSVTSSSATGAFDGPELENETEILFFKRDSTLVKAGDKGAGLFFVIEGFLDVLMPEGHIGYLEQASNASPARSEAESRATSPPPRSSGKAGSRQSSRHPSRTSSPPPASTKTANQRSPKVLFTVKPGGIAGYLSSLSGFASYVDIKAKTDVYVGFLPAKALERIMDRRPIVLLTLAKRLISLLPPLVVHIDSALEWMQVNSGQVIHRQGDKADSFYFVNQGRLRAIAEKPGISAVEILAEFGQGDSVGELDCITATPRSSTLHAIRDSELTRMPMTLFNAISVRYPEITIKISRIIGQRVRRELDSRRRTDVSGAELGKNNFNLKTVAIVPVTYQVPVTEFATKLKVALEDIGAPASYLNQATIMHVQGRHAFSKMGKLKLAGWLAEQEQKYRIVLYVADTAVSSPWTQTCIKQADCILLVAHGAAEPTIGEYERLLIGMKTTARKELVLLHSDRAVPPGSTRPWLQARPWIHAWSHCEMSNVPAHPHVSEDLAPVTAIKNLRHKVQMQIGKYRSVGGSAPQVHRPATMNDFSRLARRLCGKSIGVVLGGGGARGLSHIGALRALADAGIPIDMVGGTSIGSFIGALYAREGDLVSTLGRAKRFSGRMSSMWRMLTDVTYPIVAYTTGHEFNRGIYKSFYDYHIEDMWLTFFCNTTNITHSRMDVHYTGYVWRYVRASMTLVGLLPPLSDEGNMLVDGGYTDNLPVSTMLGLGAASVFAVDVGSIDDTSPREFGESVSGWWVLINRWNPWSATRYVPTIAEIQSRLTYVSSVKTLEEAKNTPGVLYMRMPVEQYGTMHFNKFTEIMEAGYKASKKMIADWNKQGKIPTGMVEDEGKAKQARTGRPGAGRPIRRNSI